MANILPPVPMPNKKQFTCRDCDHGQAVYIEGVDEPLECRAHPPRYCPGAADTPNNWPSIEMSSNKWCSEHKRATFAAQIDGGNNHNATTDPAAMCCASCDHYQTAPTLQDPGRGICLARAPIAPCVAQGIPYTEADPFPYVNPAELKWCSHWKRTTN